MGLRFDSLCSILEERKKELLQSIAREQEAKVQRVRGLIRQYGDHLEASSKLVETAIQAMEEPQMAVYLQVSGGAVCGGLCPVPRGSVRCSWDADGTLLSPTALQGAPEEVSGGGRGRDGDGMGGGKVGGAHAACSTPRITDMSKVSMSSRPEPGYESMDHFSINVDHVAEMLRTIDFQPGANMGRELPRGGGGLLRGCPHTEVCLCPTEALGEDDGDGPTDSSEGVGDEESLEAPEAAEGERALCRAVLCCAAATMVLLWLQRGHVWCMVSHCTTCPSLCVSTAFSPQMWGQGRSH